MGRTTGEWSKRSATNLKSNSSKSEAHDQILNLRFSPTWISDSPQRPRLVRFIVCISGPSVYTSSLTRRNIVASCGGRYIMQCKTKIWKEVTRLEGALGETVREAREVRVPPGDRSSDVNTAIRPNAIVFYFASCTRIASSPRRLSFAMHCSLAWPFRRPAKCRLLKNRDSMFGRNATCEKEPPQVKNIAAD